ncbi:hypothetical protein BD779DRAFT_1531286 [Infundibulicybe gibba]|nr:hypothetical protein BD779DRAFT_1531286 [Infundibulicybe gibba]
MIYPLYEGDMARVPFVSLPACRLRPSLQRQAFIGQCRRRPSAVRPFVCCFSIIVNGPRLGGDESKRERVDVSVSSYRYSEDLSLSVAREVVVAVVAVGFGGVDSSSAKETTLVVIASFTLVLIWRPLFIHYQSRFCDLRLSLMIQASFGMQAHCFGAPAVERFVTAACQSCSKAREPTVGAPGLDLSINDRRRRLWFHCSSQA